MSNEISDDVKRMAATIWMNRALAAEARLIAIRKILDERVADDPTNDTITADRICELASQYPQVTDHD